ncbi:glycosyltransferase [Virgibacillus dokdonensis]|nr:glycosyltransferase [Virgibacillus dokdonensis]
MKAAFIYGNADFYKDKQGKIYSGGTVTKQVWERYLKHFEKIVAVGRFMGNPPKEKKLTNITMENVEIKLIPSTNGIKSIISNSSHIRKICRSVLSNVEFAIIRLPSVTGIIACHEANKLGKPYLVEIVGCIKDALWYHGSLRGKIASLPMFLLNKHFIKKAPSALYVTQDFLQGRYPSSGLSIGCSDVTIESFNESILEYRKNKIEKMNTNTTIKLGLIGSLNVNYKGHKTAIRALSLINRKVNVELHLLGSGDKRRWIKFARKLGVEEKVVFHGVLPSGRPVLEWMDELDIYIMPSLTEGLPRALVEAMSRALPVIGANTGGIPELLELENLHSPKDHKELAKKIFDLITSKKILIVSSERNFNYSKRYCIEKLNYKRNEFMLDLMNQNNLKFKD